MCSLLERKNSSESDDEISEEIIINDATDIFENNNHASFDFFNESLQNISEKRDTTISSKSLTSERKDIRSHLQSEFEKLDSLVQNNTTNKISDSPVQISSLIPSVIPGENHPYTESMQNFCTHWILKNKKKQIIDDLRSDDIYSMPMRDIVCKFDRVYLTKLASERVELQNKDGHIYPFKYYAMFCASLWKQKNKAIMNIVIQFIDRFFLPDSQTKMAEDVASKSKDMHAIIIYDKGDVMVPKLEEHTSIIAAIIFSIERQKPIIYIDYVCTYERFIRGGFASMLINLAQHMALTKLRSSGVQDDTEVSTFINCVPELANLYSRYGFKCVNLKDISQTSHQHNCVFNHFEGRHWFDPKEAEDNQTMLILFMAKCVPRWTNFLAYDICNIEKNLYGLNNSSTAKNSLERTTARASGHLSNAMEENIFNKFKDCIGFYLRSAKYRNITNEDIRRYQSATSIGAFVKSILCSLPGFIDIGQIYNDVYDTYQDDDIIFPQKHTILFC